MNEPALQLEDDPELERLESNPGIIVIQNIEDFKLWRQRAQLGIHGIICDYPADLDTLKKAARHLEDFAKSHQEFGPLSSSDDANSPSALHLQTSIYRAPWRKGVHETHQADHSTIDFPKFPVIVQEMDQNVKDVITTLCDVFINKAKMEPAGFPFYALRARVNADAPTKPHIHGTTLSLALTQAGTVLYPDDTFENGHTVGTGQLALFDETIWHSAPEYDEDWEDEPRGHITLGVS